MRKRALGTVLLLTGQLAAAAGARDSGAPACIAQATVDRADVTVGEQVVYTVRTLRRDDVRSADWQAPPDFPGFRAFWLSEEPADEPPTRGGHRYRARAERHALFPERAGVLAIEAPTLRCTTVARPGERGTVARAPPLQVRVRPWPAGAPADFDGLVGPVALRTLVTPREVRLGETVRIAVTLRGPGALWNARDPLGDVPGADVFRRRPELATESGPRLTVKRYFAYDVVPLATGELVLPSLAVPYYDPTTGRFARASAPAEAIAVGARRAVGAPDRAADSGGAPPSPTAPAPAGGGGGRAPGWRWVAVTASLLCLGGLALLRARRRRLRAPTPGTGAAGADGFGPDLASRALRAALARHLPGTDALTAEEIRRHPALPARAAPAADLLVESDRARFDPRAAAPDRDRVDRAIAAL